jgi:hypothetical protein
MSLPQLPQEIIDNIIRNVKRSYSDEVLSNCALVSKSFRPQAQRLRFNQIMLDGRRPSHLKQFSQILVQNPALREYVKIVSLLHHGFENSLTSMGRMDDILAHVLRACRIKVLSLLGGRYSKRNIHLLSPLTLPHLRVLYTNGASFKPKILLHDVVSQHPPLDQLDLTLSYLYITHDQWSPGRELVRINRLHIYAGHSEFQDDSMLRMVYSGVEELEIDISTLETAVHVKQILEVWGVMLRRLRLCASGSLRESGSLTFIEARLS